MMKLLVIFNFMFFVASAFSVNFNPYDYSDLRYVCVSLENADDALSQIDEGERWGLTASGSARLDIFETRTQEGLRSITVKGEVFAEYVSADKFDPKTARWGGSFDSTLIENPNYRSRRYKGYSQFKEFNSPSSMWGNLVIERDTNKDQFYAHYIFRAGDHMGGTLHMICQ